MPKPKIPHNAFIFVGDGRKALFLRNEGDEKFANFVTERVFGDDNPPTHEQGTDRPGRGFASAASTRRSAMETTDWHEIEEHLFAKRVSAALEDLVRKRAAPALVIVAPPRTLSDLRHALHADVRARVVGEIDKDSPSIPSGKSNGISWADAQALRAGARLRVGLGGCDAVTETIKETA